MPRGGKLGKARYTTVKFLAACQLIRFCSPFDKHLRFFDDLLTEKERRTEEGEALNRDLCEARHPDRRQSNPYQAARQDGRLL